VSSLLDVPLPAAGMAAVLKSAPMVVAVMQQALPQVFQALTPTPQHLPLGAQAAAAWLPSWPPQQCQQRQMQLRLPEAAQQLLQPPRQGAQLRQQAPSMEVAGSGALQRCLQVPLALPRQRLRRVSAPGRLHRLRRPWLLLQHLRHAGCRQGTNATCGFHVTSAVLLQSHSGSIRPLCPVQLALWQEDPRLLLAAVSRFFRMLHSRRQPTLRCVHDMSSCICDV